MKYTNRLNLPDALVRAVMNDPYDRGDARFSVTQLLKPPRAVVLEREFDDQIVVDVSDRIFSLFGQMGHALIERAGAGNGEEIIERRFFAEIGGVRISGAGDIIKTPVSKKLYDWKFTTQWSFKGGVVKPEYVAQLNMLRLLIKKETGMEIDELFSAPIYRDWSKGESRRDRSMPQTPTQLFPVPIWTDEETEQFMLDRIELHIAAEHELPECTAAERWASPDLWKVYKGEDSKMAMKGGTFTESGDADMMAAAGAGRIVKLIRGTSIRCADYCDAAPFCEFWQSIRPGADEEQPAE